MGCLYHAHEEESPFSKCSRMKRRSLHALLFQCHSTLLFICQSVCHSCSLTIFLEKSFLRFAPLPSTTSNFKIIPVSPHAKAFISAPTPSGLRVLCGIPSARYSPSEPFHALMHFMHCQGATWTMFFCWVRLKSSMIGQNVLPWVVHTHLVKNHKVPYIISTYTITWDSETEAVCLYPETGALSFQTGMVPLLAHRSRLVAIRDTR